MRLRSARLLLLAFIVTTEAAHERWLRADTLPQGWDQAALLTAAERFREMGPLESVARFPVSPGYYPPLVPWLASVSARVFGNTDDGFTRIMPAFRVLLVVATFRLALTWLSPGAALASAVLLGTAPLVVRDTRHLTPDVPLAALTALAVLLLARSGLRTRAAAVRFGGAAGAGMLVKWTLPIYLLAPGLGVLRSSRAVRRHLPLAVIVAGSLCAGWYAVNLSRLIGGLGTAAFRGADIAADRIVSVFSIVYYPSTLPATLGWPLTGCAAIGLFVALRIPAWRRRLWTILVPLVLLILIRNKKERYFAPVYPFLAVLAGLAIDQVNRVRTRTLVVAGLTGLGLVQFVSLTFPLPWSFGESCRPRREDWPMEAVIRRASDEGGGSLAVIPDLPVFNIHMAEFQSLRAGGVVRPAGIGDVPGTFDWALVTTGNQGPWHSTPEVRTRITQELLSSSGSGALFRTVGRWNLPDGSTARLLRRRPVRADPGQLEAGLRRLWQDRFAGAWTIHVRRAPAAPTLTVELGGAALALQLDADGMPVPLPLQDLHVRLIDATPYLQPDGTIRLGCDRVAVESATIGADDLGAFLATARPYWKHGDLRLVAKPVRSFLRRLDRPAVSVNGPDWTIAGRVGDADGRATIRFSVREGRLKYHVVSLRWAGIPVPAFLVNRLVSGHLLALEYPLADRIGFFSVNRFSDRLSLAAGSWD